MEDEQLEFLNFESEPTVTENDDGSVDIEYDDVADSGFTPESEFFGNLAELIDLDTLERIGENVCDAFETDLRSRQAWEDMTLDALDHLGLEIIEESEPFEGACTATHPLILENSIKFQSKASNELLPSHGPVKTKIIGKVTEDAEDRAARIRNDMNYLVQHGIPEYYSETERALFFTGFIGNAFKRKSFDFEKNRITDEFHLPDRVVVNSLAKNLRDAERISFCDYVPERRMRNLIDSGYYRDVLEDIGEAYSPNPTEFETRIREIQGITMESSSFDDCYETIEQQCYLNLNENTMELDEDERAKPYIVVIEKSTREVLSIRRNWSEDDEAYCPLEWITHYLFVPTAGFYAFGYSHLLGNIQRTITLAMRSLADAGQFANLPGGFKLSTARVLDEEEPVGFGEFKDLECPTLVNDIRQVLMPLPFKEPSQVLHLLMNDLIAIGQKFADSTEQVIADSTNYGPVGTTMALLEASTRFFASVFKRSYNAQAHEFKIISRLVYDYMGSEYPYSVDPDQQNSRHADYDPKTIDIIPVSDPNYSSQAQRISKANAVFETAFRMPDIHDRKAAARYLYKAMAIEDEQIDVLVPPEAQPEKREPLDDLLSALKGQPVAAFKGQDHNAHIVVKQSWLQDPKNGGSEFLMAVRPVIEANIREHMFMQYAEEVGAVQAQEQISVEQATQRISRLNQIALEEAQEGSPQYILAKAEELRSQTAARSEERKAEQDQYKLGLDTLELGVKIAELEQKAKESGTKLENDTIKMAVDLMKTGYQEASKGAQEKEKKDE